MDITITPEALFYLLQIASPALPVGAYSYSDGLETLTSNGVINSPHALEKYLKTELQYGAIRIDAGVIVRCYTAIDKGEKEKIIYWNDWLSATRETTELRNAGWQMGRSLMRLLVEIAPELQEIETIVGVPCNYAIAFAIAAQYWHIPVHAATFAYLHSWLGNLVTAGIKLIPLGQTAGQQVMVNLQPVLNQVTSEIITGDDDALAACSWGLSLASMHHEVLYTRLFRS